MQTFDNFCCLPSGMRGAIKYTSTRRANGPADSGTREALAMKHVQTLAYLQDIMRKQGLITGAKGKPE